jgi:LruC domain-containing protein
MKTTSTIWTVAALLLAAPAWAQDYDSDGAADGADAFPCEPAWASAVYAPSQAGWSMLAFEDQWPAYTDLDFNDVVVLVHHRVYRDAQGKARRVVAVFDPAAAGGEFTNGLGLHLPVSSAGASVRRRVGGGAWETLYPEPDTELTVVVSNNLRELFGFAAGPINAVAGQPRQAGQQVEVELDLGGPSELDAGAAPYDVFIFRSGDLGHQIHFPGFGGTQAMNGALFNTQNDVSRPGRSFIHRNGTPFALNLQDTTVYPLEAVRIEAVFPDIVGFAASGGAQNQDFYLSDVVAAQGLSVTPGALPAEPAPSCLACSIADGWGTQAFDGVGYGGCTPYACATAFHIEGAACLADTRSCAVSHGTGTRSWSGGWSTCAATGCDATYHLEAGACTSDNRACTIANGAGAQSWTGAAWSTCAPVSCDPAFHIEAGGCAADVRACTVANGSGSQSWSGGWSACVASACNPSFHVEAGACVSDVRGCAIANGAGTQSWSGSAWSSCTASSCSSGFHVEGGACTANTRSCSVTNGSGTQSWNGAAWSSCSASSCSAGFHVEGGACYPNTRACAVANGSGLETWTGSGWSACGVSGCNAGYTQSGSACVPASPVTYTFGSGSSNASYGGWGITPPAGATRMQIWLWGAGGGGGSNGGYGGDGGSAFGVVSAANFSGGIYVVIGGGGGAPSVGPMNPPQNGEQGSAGFNGGGGAGHSDLLLGGNLALVAGGGGGSGGMWNVQVASGGAGGGTNGGSQGGSSAQSGGGAGQGGGGSGGNPAYGETRSDMWGQAGSRGQGGTGGGGSPDGQDRGGGGGGGGGWYGGGGGGAVSTAHQSAGGGHFAGGSGGGGSGYYDPTRVSQASLTTGISGTHWDGAAGRGGSPSTSGTIGRAVVTFYFD